MKRLLFVFAAILLISCNEEDTYSLKGNAFGFEDGTHIYVYQIDDNNNTSVIDTLEVQNEQFEAQFPKTEDATTALQFLKVGNQKNNILFFTENEDLKATLYADSIMVSKVSGGKQNEVYYDYIETMRGFANERSQLMEDFRKAQAEQDVTKIQDLRNENMAITNEEKSYQRDFAVNNSNSVFGLMLMTELFSRKDMTSEEVNDLINGLSPKMAAHPLVTKLQDQMEAAKQAELGSVAPNFEAETPEGTMLSLKDAMGTYTIIDFWASWCRPCRMENPNVVRVYNKYHDKGLNIISVSLDKKGQKDRWIKAIEDDNMDWYHVSNLEFWQDPIARQYNVRSIPATFLLDSEGKIIDKNLRGQALEDKIASLLE
ncbi:MAG: peroxiredoxin [Alteromonas sp.]|nr:peroxiredoxin [Alteromonas sp.]MAY22887.1 peroxiredoxin [Flavobacteriaceae bacterium]|tara:strand:+ start:38989 stop:40104 length:1116 start_codon:yes stop_codon:yes gene_type:complete